MSRSLPEELLARILALALAPPPRPASDIFPARNRIALLLVSRQFFRIASPLFYHTLHLRTPHHAKRAFEVLTYHRALADGVRRIIFGGIWHDCASALVLCHYVQDVDVCLDASPCLPTPGDSGDMEAEAFCHALERTPTIIHLTVRKNPTVYLTHPRPTYVLGRLAEAVRHWSYLETVHIAFRISASPSTMTLVQALSAAPRLRSVRAQLPMVWNTFLLVVSANPQLERVMLYTEPAPVPGPGLGSAMQTLSLSRLIHPALGDEEVEHVVLGTGMYMTEAKKHARFLELVRAGTSIVRTRAHTTIATLSMPSAGGAPLGAIRAKEVAVELMADRDGFGAAVAPSHIATRQTHVRDV